MVGCSDIFAKYRLARMSDGVKTRWRRGGQVLTPGRFFFLQELTLSPTSETRSSHPLSDDIWPNADVRCTLCDLLDVPSWVSMCHPVLCRSGGGWTWRQFQDVKNCCFGKTSRSPPSCCHGAREHSYMTRRLVV